MKSIKTTDLDFIKDRAKALIYFDIEETSLSFIVRHPYTDSWFASLEVDGEKKIADLHDPVMLQLWRNKLEKLIDEPLPNLILLHILNIFKYNYYR